MVCVYGNSCQGGGATRSRAAGAQLSVALGDRLDPRNTSRECKRNGTCGLVCFSSTLNMHHICGSLLFYFLVLEVCSRNRVDEAEKSRTYKRWRLGWAVVVFSTRVSNSCIRRTASSSCVKASARSAQVILTCWGQVNEFYYLLSGSFGSKIQRQYKTRKFNQI